MDSPPSASRDLPLDSDGRLDADFPCISCGYNLRGLSPGGQCPECAADVGRSASSDLLRFCEPRWLEALVSGLKWLVASILLGFASMTLSTATIVFAEGVGAPVGALGDNQVVTALGSLLRLAFLVVGVVGYWKVTTPEANPPDRAQRISARQVARFCLAAAFSLHLATTGAFGYGGDLPTGAIAALMGLVGTAALLLYAAALARRIPDLRLARSTRIVMWGLVGISAANHAVWMLIAFSKATRVLFSSGEWLSLFGIVLTGFEIWCIVLIVQYYKALRRQNNLALGLRG